MSIRPQIRELPPYDYEPGPEGVKLDQNELPFDLPPRLREAVLERVQALEFNRYPELDSFTLRSEIARLHDWPVEGVVVTPGSNVLIRSLVIAAGIGQAVLSVRPTFSVYAQQARMLGAPLVEVPLLPGFELPVDDLEREMEGGTGVLFLANPAAPTGNLHGRAAIERLIRAAGESWTVVLDEAYCEFAGGDLRDLARRPGVISLRTFSKAFGAAGVRLGYALATPELAGHVRKTVLPFNLSALQEAVAHVLLGNRDLLAARVRDIVEERERLMASLQRMSQVRAFPSSANFLLLEVPEARRTHRALQERGILARYQSQPGLGSTIRVSVGTREQNDAFLAALNEVLNEVEG